MTQDSGVAEHPPERSDQPQLRDVVRVGLRVGEQFGEPLAAVALGSGSAYLPPPISRRMSSSEIGFLRYAFQPWRTSATPQPRIGQIGQK